MDRYSEILLYTAAWCGDCRRARYWLDEHQIPYQPVDIETDSVAAHELETETGKRGIPYLKLDGHWFRGYRPGSGVNFADYRELFAAYLDNA